MKLKMSLPVALGEGSEPSSQVDWNVTRRCQDTHFYSAERKPQKRPAISAPFPLAIFSVF